MRRPVAAIAAFAFLVLACVAQSESVDFNRDVRPILANSCFQCHGPDEQTREANLRLDIRESAVQPTESGIVPIVPGSADESELLRRILADDESEIMPPPSANKELSNVQKETLRKWIDQGAEYQQHWAFQPPVQQTPPTVLHPEWLRNPIDEFILARIESDGLDPAQMADRHTLARRATLDLLGKPPTQSEADDFVHHPAPDAYDRLLDRLFASPRYGERWARKWLDLARYADTNGYEKDRVRSIWPFRDWVINAFNDDMSFDTFTVKQLAGDMLEPNSLPDQIATGFHRNTMINEEGGVDPLEYRFHAMVDRVATTGVTWMGLTIGCAQCHTHKFDPITQTDYYRTMALLNNADEPMIPVPDPLTEQRRARILAQVAQMESQLPQRFPPEGDLEWAAIQPKSAQAKSGATMVILDDGSVLATGNSADKDSYTFDFQSESPGLAAIRLVALTDSTLPHTGPGRATNGNFVLTNFELRRSGDNSSSEPVRLFAPKADFEQSGFPASTVLDSDPKTGWAVAGPQPFNTERSISLRLVDPLVQPGSTQWTIHIGQEYGGNHTLGRFRIYAGRFINDGRSIDQRRHDHLQRRFDEWLTDSRSKAVPWTILRPSELSSNLPFLSILDDHSILASGDQSKSDRYDLKFPTDQTAITAIRLEAIPDSRLPANGPGRVYYEGPYGDFNLSDFQVRIDGQRVPIARAYQSYADGKNAAAFAIDDNLQTGWSINGGQGRPHVAVFEFDRPIDPKNVLDLSMQFEKYYSAGLGRFRISVTSQKRSDPEFLIPSEIESFLASPEQTPAQRDQLLQYFLSVVPELEFARNEIENRKKQTPQFPTTLVFNERPPGRTRPTHRHHRGEFLQPEETVEPGVPSLFSIDSSTEPRDRLAFARWLVDGSNPLTARVVVNRHWAALFGRGIVTTVEDFGYQGQPPTHPLLLDWLAVEWPQQDWSIKRLHRLMVTSSTYRQSSAFTADRQEKDPENRLFSRHSRFRLDAEVIRDSLLAVGDRLSTKMCGPSVFPPQPRGVTSEGTYGPLEWKLSEGEDRYRRGLYTFSKRTAPYAMFATFDAPSGEACIARRESSNTPLQALTSLNDDVFQETAQILGSSTAALEKSDHDRMIDLFRTCLIRPPSEDEAELLLRFLETQQARLRTGELNAEKIAQSGPGDPVDRAAWTLVARAILNLDEFVVNE